MYLQYERWRLDLEFRTVIREKEEKREKRRSFTSCPDFIKGSVGGWQGHGHHWPYNTMPDLVHVSREKRPGSPHHFKAGALNVLIRVSATMTNAPVVLTLDSDMHSNDPQTLLRALCYLLDPDMDPNLGFVQFPQTFHGINKNDI
ncbi:cellulose synthase-like protein G1 [Vitis vinifera]|nr:cellulose synthase-like protein G1 [Vitis vinifera]RVW43191.1 Cellulose synthase-like protein G1 [Vitis vinifera]